MINFENAKQLEVAKLIEATVEKVPNKILVGPIAACDRNACLEVDQLEFSGSETLRRGSSFMVELKYDKNTVPFDQSAKYGPSMRNIVGSGNYSSDNFKYTGYYDELAKTYMGEAQTLLNRKNGIRRYIATDYMEKLCTLHEPSGHWIQQAREIVACGREVESCDELDCFMVPSLRVVNEYGQHWCYIHFRTNLVDVKRF